MGKASLVEVARLLQARLGRLSLSSYRALEAGAAITEGLAAAHAKRR
jgi:hypothetical protein